MVESGSSYVGLPKEWARQQHVPPPPPLPHLDKGKVWRSWKPIGPPRVVESQAEGQWDCPNWPVTEGTDQDPIKATVGSLWTWYWTYSGWVLGPKPESDVPEGTAIWERTQYGWLERRSGKLCEWNEFARRGTRKFQLPERDLEQTPTQTREASYFDAAGGLRDPETVERPASTLFATAWLGGSARTVVGGSAHRTLIPSITSALGPRRMPTTVPY